MQMQVDVLFNTECLERGDAEHSGSRSLLEVAQVKEKHSRVLTKLDMFVAPLRACSTLNFYLRMNFQL